MSAEISKWLLEDIDEASLEQQSEIQPLETDAAYHVSPYYAVYNDYYDYYDYSVYYNYYNYSDYYNYYNYYNYSNSISITLNPVSQSTLINEEVTFSVAASNTIDSCQWYYATSATSAGILIQGATSPTYRVIATRDLDNRYYYCIVRRGGNSATSSRALLTIRAIDVFDVYITVNSSSTMFFVRGTPPTTGIASAVVENTNIASIIEGNKILGISEGSTTCTVTGTNGAKATFRILVLPDTVGNKLAAIFFNNAIAIREYKQITHSIYPNQMANLIRGNRESIHYDTTEELLTDIADSIREIDGSTGLINPEDLYYRILLLTTI